MYTPPCFRQKLHWQARTGHSPTGFAVRYSNPIAPQWQRPRQAFTCGCSTAASRTPPRAAWRRSASRRSSGGAISLRAARSIQPPSLRMRAASRPSPFRISFTSRKREPSGARPASASVTVIGSCRPISRWYSSSSRRTTGPMLPLGELGHREAVLLEEAHARVHALVQVGEVRHVGVRVHVGPAGDRGDRERLAGHVQQWKFSLLPSRSRK